jgi:hypothetical protein
VADVLDAHDDAEARVELPGRERDHDVVVVGLSARDQAASAIDAGGHQNVVLRGIPQDDGNIRELTRGSRGVRIVADHQDHRSLNGGELCRSVARGAAGAAHDVVVTKAGQVAFHSPSPKDMTELALQEERRSGRHEVQYRAHPEQDQDRREDPGPVSFEGDLLPIAHRGQRDRGHEERPDQPGARVDDREPDDPDQGHEDDEAECPQEALSQVAEGPLPLCG